MPRLRIIDANPNFLTLSGDKRIAAHKHTKIYKDETGSEFQLFGAIWTADMGDTMSPDKKDFLKNYYVDIDDIDDKDTKRLGGGRRRSSSRRKNYKKSVRRVKTAKRASRSASRKYRNRK